MARMDPILVESERERIDAEALNFKAQAAAALASETKLRAEARHASALAQQAEILAHRAVREEAAMLAGDRYHHVYYFGSSVDSSAARACMKQLAEWQRLVEDGRKPDIEIIFSSPGGSVFDGLALFDYIQGIRQDGFKVITSAIGYAASMAGILLQAGDVRRMGAESYILIHEAAFGVGGKIGEVEDEVAFMKQVQARVLEIFARRSRLTVKQLARGWRRKDWWISSTDALKYGLVDEISGATLPSYAGSDTIDNSDLFEEDD